MINNTDIDIENINQIDTSINPKFLDDDDSFGSIRDVSTNENFSDDRNFQPKTGVIIDLSDDEDARPIRKIEAKVNNMNGIDIETNFNSDLLNSAEYNSVDTETDYFDDEDDDLILKTATKKDAVISFENDLDESIEMAEAKKKKPTGEVNKNYWRDLTKKHLKSNKKGAYNTHFHLAGNPKADREFFNRAMGLGDSEMDDAAIDGITSVSITGNINGIAAAGDALGDFGGGDGGSMGESVSAKKCIDSNVRALKELLDITGLEIIKTADNSFILIDLLEPETEHNCKDIDELKYNLQPYMEDCFIYPLQIATNQKFNRCEDWCRWYDNEENRKAYPKCADDVKYCDLVANQLNIKLIEDLYEID